MRVEWLFTGLAVLACLAAPAVAAPAGESLPEIFRRVDSSVVVVHTSGRVIPPRRGGKPVSVAGLGSGVLISDDGKVITAAHVVQVADEVGVEFADDTIVRARVVASDVAADVALLQLDAVPPGFAPAALGDSDLAQVGDQVFVVGAPRGISHTLTVGYLSARRPVNRTFGGMATAEFFQTDAAINEGNSGGPLFNMQGEVIGIVSHIVSRSGGSEGLGFVVTANVARRLLLEEPSVWSGLEGYLLTGEIARAFNIPAPGSGLLVQRIAVGAPADRFGLRGGNIPAVIGGEMLLLGGDLILAVDGIDLGKPDAYDAIRRRLIELRESGGTIRILVLRGGSTVELAGTAGR